MDSFIGAGRDLRTKPPSSFKPRLLQQSSNSPVYDPKEKMRYRSGLYLPYEGKRRDYYNRPKGAFSYTLTLEAQKKNAYLDKKDEIREALSRWNEEGKQKIQKAIKRKELVETFHTALNEDNNGQIESLMKDLRKEPYGTRMLAVKGTNAPLKSFPFPDMKLNQMVKDAAFIGSNARKAGRPNVFARRYLRPKGGGLAPLLLGLAIPPAIEFIAKAIEGENRDGVR